ncbi:hypothetical protein IID23_03235 [Patescibacteria group bacterium]|nr:hypothetical protein [Patescibacteria group bacterium]
MGKIPKPGHVILHTKTGDVEMPESEAFPHKPPPIVDEGGRFVWTRNVPLDDQQLFQERLGDSVRFGNVAVSPSDGVEVAGNVGVFIHEDHDYHTLMAIDFYEKHGWY